MILPLAQPVRRAVRKAAVVRRDDTRAGSLILSVVRSTIVV
jgi:hypothetical protein